MLLLPGGDGFEAGEEDEMEEEERMDSLVMLGVGDMVVVIEMDGMVDG